MKKVLVVAVMALLLGVGLLPAQASAQSDQACWGQASAVFAQMGAMGEHSSRFENPRLGLKNLAEALYDAGVIDAPTMQALGAYVAAELGLSIDACQ
jgi:hypothetical protein